MPSNSSQLTQANLASHQISKITEGTNPEKQTMQRFRQEHDQYRHFLVTGDTKDRNEQTAKHQSANGGTPDRKPKS